MDSSAEPKKLSPKLQLEQLLHYFDVTYPLPSFAPPWKGGDGDPDPADRYVGKLPDRITHASMLLLGSAVDHSMPGVAFTTGVTVEDLPELSSVVFRPSSPTGRWAVSLHSGGWWRGSGEALEFQWRPEVAAAAELSGTTIIDVDHPLAPAATVPEMCAAVVRAVDYARTQGASSVTVWGYSSGGALAALLAPHADALVLTFPDLASLDGLPDAVRGDAALPVELPRTMLQVALHDEIAARPQLPAAEEFEYVSSHRISTPEVARQRIRDTAEFLRSV
ncbi:alpha/beta hydrolase [Corynebacterium uterequi]|uniref:Alpha/beta hydrolase fold n=1 Tax=Corynebacterium uterequi TaxID=1072256 RepID=A0A0G3H9Y7_9CORY|nr:alpha/beta hydrolase fold domain-containing protein [Corynebacterium uterequi]AKK10109.1 alpha/beta hydrolase fold [Corynebacterium uterequi]